MEEKIILLKALSKDGIRLKPSKNQFLAELVNEYGFNPNHIKSLLAEVNREELIEIDSMTRMVSITAKGRQFITDNLRKNYINSAYQVANSGQIEPKKKRLTDWNKIAAIATIIGVLATILGVLISMGIVRF